MEKSKKKRPQKKKLEGGGETKKKVFKNFFENNIIKYLVNLYVNVLKGLFHKNMINAGDINYTVEVSVAIHK